MKFIYTVIAILFFIELNAVTRYVTPTGAGLMNGSSWVNAFSGTSLQTTINSSAPGDEVWVATGIYFTTNAANRNIYFNMLNGVAIYGSFNGTETLLSQRVFSCGFTSILSAEIGLPGNADNSYHVISNSSLNNTAILDGFTITGANANFDLVGNDNRSLGGGMLNNAANGGACSPTIRNCLFTNNTALFGGGIFNHGQNGGNANPVITNCIFAFNTANQGGGGIDNFGYNGNASPVITNSIFYNNTAVSRAGAIYCWGGGNGNANPVVLNSLFVNNSSVDGGGIVSDRTNFASGNSGTANPIIRNSIFWGNTASGTGPQFYILGAANFTATYTVIDVTNQNSPHIITGPGTGNIFLNPIFLNISDADGADNCWLTIDDGLQLQLSSAGIDAGDNSGVPAFDIRYYNRIANTVVDMGAYEFNSAVLPVTLINFYGQAILNANKLFWITASEINNRFFEVQRSVNGIQFEKIGEVNSAGNSNILRQYHFVDKNLRSELYYYRLKQIDINGKIAFSQLVLLKNSALKNIILVYPNPVLNKAILLFPAEMENQEFYLFNSLGQMIDRIKVSGRSDIIDLSDKSAGVFFLLNQKLEAVIRINKIESN
jgi:hypothetical protein